MPSATHRTLHSRLLWVRLLDIGQVEIDAPARFLERPHVPATICSESFVRPAAPPQGAEAITLDAPAAGLKGR
jgi:hypothetical protein